MGISRCCKPSAFRTKWRPPAPKWRPPPVASGRARAASGEVPQRSATTFRSWWASHTPRVERRRRAQRACGQRLHRLAHGQDRPQRPRPGTRRHADRRRRPRDPGGPQRHGPLLRGRPRRHGLRRARPARGPVRHRHRHLRRDHRGTARPVRVRRRLLAESEGAQPGPLRVRHRGSDRGPSVGHRLRGLRPHRCGPSRRRLRPARGHRQGPDARRVRLRDRRGAGGAQARPRSPRPITVLASFSDKLRPSG
jgi:hypothetical protein